MRKLLQYVPLHFLVCYILGVLLNLYFSIINNNIVTFFVSICTFTIVLFFLKNRKFITLCSLLLFFSIGVFSSFINNDKNASTYFEKYATKNQTSILQIKKKLKSTAYYNKFEATLIQVNNIKTIGKILVNIKKDSLQKQIHIDDKIVTKSSLVTILKPKNPNQFSYKNYLAHQQIYKQVFLTDNQFLIKRDDKFSLARIVENSKNAIKGSLNNYSFSKDELSILYALFLGEKQLISQELKANYSKAGVIHILAISGLHVGILVIIFLFLLKPIEYLKNGVTHKLLITIILLWSFAIFTGLSASVVRAVTMYSFVAIGQLINRKTPIYFSLITSILVLLLIKPLFLFDVGFQLSYCAVFSIVWIQPTLRKLYKPKYKIVKYFLDLITVSTAAQLGVLPLSIFYFNQVPGLFLVANLVVIPTLFLVLILGIATIISSLFFSLPEPFIRLFSWLISSLNSFVNWVSDQEVFLLKKLYISSFLMLCIYAIIIASILIIKKRTTKRFVFLSFGIISFQFVFILEKHQKNTTRELLVFYKPKTSIVVKRNGNRLVSNKNAAFLKEDYATKSYIESEKITKIDAIDFKNIFAIDKQPVLLIDSLGIYNVTGLEKPIVILQHSPKINVQRMIKTLQPQLIIADASNYKNYVKQWQEIAEKQKTPFYNVSEKGAFMYKF
jgi:competence protein ComEC